ncbi:AsnB Asparagine synthase (glutamine-hydrolyzing) [Candidatus Methylopumilus universalis]|uniref:asparagine synthase (glutamine-hydrolyzing) n=1 Tax=Candidatus Methylopumilus universalis TaxID=2588536 RepID=UPI003BEEDF69
MCGIAGFFTKSPDQSLDSSVLKMVNTLSRRGPDDLGTWVDATLGIAMGHRRLSIVDISSAGHQPMTSECGRYVIVFNGEIYNHLELRQFFSHFLWRSQCDTETLLVCFAAWGVEKTLSKLVGMFAFAIWDNHEKTLTLARDRLGEKPLFYGWNGNNFFFGSELKAIAAHSNWEGKINLNALKYYLQYGYVPAPMSIWLGIKKLLPGSYLKISPKDSDGKLSPPSFYWKITDHFNCSGSKELDENFAIDELDFLLRRSVLAQMHADVPSGAFLSGGVDSSSIVALMQEQSKTPVKTFTIGFDVQGYDEAAYAGLIAKHLGTDHKELYVSSQKIMEVIPELPCMYDEPFGDVSQIPTFLISKMAKESVAVSLSGDGADELFGGYNRYFLGPAIWNRMKYFSPILRNMLASSIFSISPNRWDLINRLLPKRLQQPMLGDRIHKFASILSAKNMDDIYTYLASQERNPESLIIHSDKYDDDSTPWAQAEMKYFKDSNFANSMMCNDLISYLTDDILCKVDRASMYASLEVRAPYLDHRLVEFALKLPINLKIRNGESKWLLRKVLYRYVPKSLIERPKQGFSVPIDLWLKGPLRDWAEDLLNESEIKKDGYLNFSLIKQRWSEHLSGRRNWQYWLWNILMFQAWNRTWNHR